MTGMALAQALRADPACGNVGFVLTTSGGESDDLSSLKDLPHTVLMPKPFDTKKLAEALSAATGRS
jgi:CheY-like chemotaxis protein